MSNDAFEDGVSMEIEQDHDAANGVKKEHRLPTLTPTQENTLTLSHKRPHGKRKSNAELDRRRVLVERLLLEGGSSAEVIKVVQRNHQACERQIQNDISLIRKRWADEASRAHPEVKGEALARLMENRRMLKDERAWTAFMACERLICEIQGLRTGSGDKTLNVQVNSQGPTQVNVALTPEDQEHEARTLLAAIERERRKKLEEPSE